MSGATGHCALRRPERRATGGTDASRSPHAYADQRRRTAGIGHLGFRGETHFRRRIDFQLKAFIVRSLEAERLFVVKADLWADSPDNSRGQHVLCAKGTAERALTKKQKSKRRSAARKDYLSFLVPERLYVENRTLLSFASWRFTPPSHSWRDCAADPRPCLARSRRGRPITARESCRRWVPGKSETCLGI